jgi:flavin-dependent dehydrogenase
MFFNLLNLRVPDVTPGCFSFFFTLQYNNTNVGCSSGKTSWNNVRYAQSQNIENHPGVTSGTLKVKRLKNIME